MALRGSSPSAIPSVASCRRGPTSRSTTMPRSGRRSSMWARSRASSRRRPATAISLCAISLRSLRSPASTSSSPVAPRRCRFSSIYLLGRQGQGGYLRLISVPWPVPFAYPAKRLEPGQGVVLWEAKDAPAVAIVTYGLIMTAEAYLAAEELAEEGIDALVIACPFLNRIDGAWFAEKLKGLKLLVTIDNHYLNGGLWRPALGGARAGRERLALSCPQPRHHRCAGLGSAGGGAAPSWAQFC